MASVPVYCLCRLPYDVTRFMIECDICQDWFHGRYGFFFYYIFLLFNKILIVVAIAIFMQLAAKVCRVQLMHNCFLCSCVGVEEDKATEIDLYHCPNCEVTHGPSVSE